LATSAPYLAKAKGFYLFSFSIHHYCIFSYLHT